VFVSVFLFVVGYNLPRQRTQECFAFNSISKYKSSSKNKHCIAGDQSQERLNYPTMIIITGLPVKASAGLT
jgi:hypothetical protein